ncbi:MAG: pantoate--beta-alanine ligase [Bacteroidota bacterium]
MITAESILKVRALTQSWKKQGLSIGFVPTMGYLHDGHTSLINRARRENDKVVVSIFVNPTQFGPNEDFEKYPKSLERDREICERAGTDLIFAPSVAEIYPSKNLAFVDISELDQGLCGAKRPGHFRGVCTVVSKLFNIVMPDRAYFGEKDAQQLAIIRWMTEDLNFNIQIVPCPTVRDQDGLALSSRNSYLSETERKAARVIPESLDLARQALVDGETDANVIKGIISEKITTEPLATIDYIEVVDSSLLKPVVQIDKPVLIAVAVFIGGTRLIDNFSFKEGS